MVSLIIEDGKRTIGYYNIPAEKAKRIGTKYLAKNPYALVKFKRINA